MNEEQKTIAELQAALLDEKKKNAALEARNTNLEDRIAELEAINARKQAKTRPSITRARFDR